MAFGSEGLGIAFKRILLAWLITAATVGTACAQGQLASGTISYAGSGPSYTYSLTFKDSAAATSPIGSIWYSWVPGSFYLPDVPTSASAPPGWTATVSGKSVQYTANAPANDIAPGGTLSGFGYIANFSPSQLATAPNSGVSVAYSAGLFSDNGNTFTVQIVPEPSVLALVAPAIAGLGWYLRRKGLAF
jgi:hypothetical protein